MAAGEFVLIKAGESDFNIVGRAVEPAGIENRQPDLPQARLFTPKFHTGCAVSVEKSKAAVECDHLANAVVVGPNVYAGRAEPELGTLEACASHTLAVGRLRNCQQAVALDALFFRGLRQK